MNRPVILAALTLSTVSLCTIGYSPRYSTDHNTSRGNDHTGRASHDTGHASQTASQASNNTGRASNDTDTGWPVDWSIGARAHAAEVACGPHQHPVVEKDEDEGSKVTRCVCDEGWESDAPDKPCHKSKPTPKTDKKPAPPSK